MSTSRFRDCSALELSIDEPTARISLSAIPHPPSSCSLQFPIFIYHFIPQYYLRSFAMRITDVKVFELEGLSRSGLALYEIQRGGLEPEQVTPHR